MKTTIREFSTNSQIHGYRGIQNIEKSYWRLTTYFVEQNETYFEIGTHCNHSLEQYVLMITRCANHKSVINSRYYDSYTSRWWLRCSSFSDMAQDDVYTTPVYNSVHLVVSVKDSFTIIRTHTEAAPGLKLSPSKLAWSQAYCCSRCDCILLGIINRRLGTG